MDRRAPCQHPMTSRLRAACAVWGYAGARKSRNEIDDRIVHGTTSHRTDAGTSV